VGATGTEKEKDEGETPVLNQAPLHSDIYLRLNELSSFESV
jgi:hypothetical protein